MNLKVILSVASLAALSASPAMSQSTYTPPLRTPYVPSGAFGSAATYGAYGYNGSYGPYAPNIPTPPYGKSFDFQGGGGDK